MSSYKNTFVAVATFEPAEEVRVHVGHKSYPEGIVVSNGTVEVTLQGKTRRVPALRRDDGRISARGMVGRYQTSSKAWPAYVEVAADGASAYVHFGRDDRSGRFNKANSLFFGEA